MQRCPSCGDSNPAGVERCQACGAELRSGTGATGRPGDDLESRVRALLEQGQKIEAIRVYREATGTGLAEAKDAVEALGRGGALSAEAGTDRDFEDELVALLQQGQKIQAIKRYRERTGVGLKEAKDAVEALADRHGISVRGVGCGPAALVLLSAGVLLGGLALRTLARSDPPKARSPKSGGTATGSSSTPTTHDAPVG
jgi:large subunit ribosomal protein L7/L12